MWDAYWKVEMPVEEDEEPEYEPPPGPDPVEILPEPEKPEPEFTKTSATEWVESMEKGAAAWSKAHPQKIPDASPEAGAHVHEEAVHEHPGPALPSYMQQQHQDRHFQHSSAPMHLPPAHIKTI